MRRRLQADLAVVDAGDPEQLPLSFAELTDETLVYEYAVLITSLPYEIVTIAHLYRDRGDAENPFYELKNHWGWGGFTTQDLKRCRFMARITALTYNGWGLFVRLANPHQHTEAITARPLLLHAPARLTRHGGQTRLTITHPHAEAPWVEQLCREIAAFLKTLRQTAEQFDPLRRWDRVLSRASSSTSTAASSTLRMPSQPRRSPDIAPNGTPPQAGNGPRRAITALFSIMDVVEPLADAREAQQKAFALYRQMPSSPAETDHAILELYRSDVINVQRIAEVDYEWREPSFEELREEWNAWCLFNAVTFFLNGRIVGEPKNTQELHRIIDGVCVH
jgi:hypothetical protein